MNNNKVPQTGEDLENQLKEQLELLSLHCKAYDEGHKVMAKSIATSLRVLLHDTPASRSLLGQLNKKDTLFYNTAEVQTLADPTMIRAGSFSALIGIHVGVEGGFVPYMDDMPGYQVRRSKFAEYWDEVIFIDQSKVAYTRKELVLFIANQDGGSHVDPELDEKFVNLTRRNSLGWMSSLSTETQGLPQNLHSSDMHEVLGAEQATIRQIAHEVLRTFSEDYNPTYAKPDNGFVMGGGGIMLGISPEPEFDPRTPRNQKCPCGSGKKYKYCHGFPPPKPR